MSEWHDILALNPQFYAYAGAGEYAANNPETIAVSGAYYGIRIPMLDVVGDGGLLPGAIITKIRMAGTVTTSSGATGNAFLSNGVVDYAESIILPLVSSGTVTLSTGDLDADPNTGGNLVLAVVSISPSQDCVFELTQFEVFVDGYTVPEPEPNDGSEVFVHTLNAGRGKWSRYLFPFAIDAFSQLSGELFIRTGDRVVKVVEGKLTDHAAGTDVGFTGTVQWPWIDAGQPGVTKQMIGFDLVASGSPSVSFGFNQSDLSMFTTPYAVSADTMTGGVIPMPLMSPSFSLRLDFAAGSAWNVRSATLYLNDGKWQP